MLHFIFGRAVSGKTTTVLNRIKEDVDSGDKNVVLLVPEQSSFDYERALLRILGDGRFTSVPVLSFTRLLDEVGRKSGGICGKHLTNCGKTILMSRALRSVADNLLVLGKYVNSTSFIGSIIKTIDEFKRCSVGSDVLREYSEKSNGMLARKLYDLALIYDAYDGITSGVFLDASDDMFRLNSLLSEYAYFSEKTVYIDAFKNFTGAQLKVIEQVIRQADDVVFSFCFDNKKERTGLFSNVLKTVTTITDIAQKYGVEIAEPTLLEGNFYSSEALYALEECMATGNRTPYEADAPDITICEADSIYDETEFVANEIRRLVREEGYRYRDFVVMCRDDEQYRRSMEHICEKYGVPCFKDKRHSIEHTPLPIFLASAMRASKTFQTEDILRFLKTELAGFSFDEISELENYLYVWKIDRAMWKTEWTGSPSGFDGFSEKDAEKLLHLNQLRKEIVTLLEGFSDNFSQSADRMCSALWKLMCDCNVGERLAALCEDKTEREFVSGAYDAVLGVLDSLHDTLGDTLCTPELFSEYFNLAVADVEVGTIPQMLDEITFGAADRIKPSRPKVAFVIGLNQGVFPSVATAGGIIGGSERIKLLKMGLPISDYTLGFSVDEEYLLYTSLCCATDKLYACYTNTDAAGKAAKPSAVLDMLYRVFKNCRKKQFGKDSFTPDRVETRKAAFSSLMRDYDGEFSPLMRALFLGDAEYDARLDYIEKIRENKNDKLSDGYGERLFGKDMYISATAVDTYYGCSFSYFCKYGLRAKSLDPAEINVLQRGTIVHEVLEKTVTKYGKDICKLTNQQIIEETNQIVDDYLAAIKGIEQVADARMEYIVTCIKKLAAQVVCHLRDEFAQSGFEPIKCELKIGGDGADIEQAVLKTPEGSVVIRGAIDRVDSFGAYIRVVDYKTGKREFALSDVLYGLNMQMLLYLYAALKSKRFEECKPAGVLYLEANSKIGDENPFAMNGIVSDNRDVITAMEENNEGKYIPALKLNKDGTPSKTNTSYIDEELFYDVFMHIERLLLKMNKELLEGKISVNPRDMGNDKDACKYCKFSSVCGIENRKHDKTHKHKNEELKQMFKEGTYGF